MITPLPLQLTDASGVPYYRQLVDQLEEGIRRGRLRSGDPLPSVRELARHLRVSVITTRRAYADLEQLGLVERRQGLGTFVADGVEPRARRAAEARAREALEGALAEARGLGLSNTAIRGVVEHWLNQGEDE